MRAAMRVQVLAIACVAVCSCSRKEAKDSEEFKSPQEISQAFITAVFKDPEYAYSLCDGSERGSLKEFKSALRMMLPPPNTITSINRLGFEDGYTESDGLTSSATAYEVLSSDDFQPNCRVEVCVVSQEGKYKVRRLQVSTPP